MGPRHSGDVDMSFDELRATLRDVGDGVTVLDAAARLIYANDAAARILGLRGVEELMSVEPQDRLTVFECFRESGERYQLDELPTRRALSEGRVVRELVGFRRRGSQSLRHVLMTASPVLAPDGRPRFVVNVLRDISDRVGVTTHAVRTATRLARLQQVTAVLAEATTAREVTTRLAGSACEILHAASCAVYLRDGTSLCLEHVADDHHADGTSAPGNPGERDGRGWPRLLSIDDDQPAARAARRRAAVLWGGGDETASAGGGVRAAIPIMGLGALELRYRPGHRFRSEDRELFDALGLACAQALERARLFDAEHAARTEAEAAQRRASFLARASALLGASLAYETTLDQIARAAVPAIADWCLVDLVDEDGQLVPVAGHHRDPDQLGKVRALRARTPVDAGASEWSIGKVVRGGCSVLHAEIDDGSLVAAARDEEHLALLRALAPRSAIIAPLRIAGRCLGALTFVRGDDRRYTEDDLRLAEDLGARAAVAIDNARLYRAEREAHARASEAERRKDEFLAILGHELRNPLAPIVTALELMKMDPAAGNHPREVIERQVLRLERLIDDLLDVSRITRGKVVLRQEPIELADVVSDAVEVTAPLLEERRHQLTVDVAGGLVVRGDRVRLAQVVTNLVNNAAKYTRPGGHIEIVGEHAGDRARLSVRDDGIGIDAALRPRLFEMFVQGESSGERVGLGLGLGLTIVQHLVALHHGEVDVYSDGPDRGSTFEIVLPLALRSEGRQPARPLVHSDTQPHAFSRRVLVVDDNADAAELLAIGLRRAGHDTLVAGDGPSALRAARRFRPDAALVDIGLPVMDGYELARRLRASAPNGLRLIAITGYGQPQDRQRAREAGFDQHFVKPVSLERVVAALMS